MTKTVDTFYRIAGRAYLRDNYENVYHGDQLLLALLLHTTGSKRTREDEEYVGALLDNPNLKK